MPQLTLKTIFAAISLSTVLAIPASPQVGGGIGNGTGIGMGLGGTLVGVGPSSSRSDQVNQTFTYAVPKGAAVVAVTGAPYSGRSSSQTIRTLANGTHLTQPSFEQPMTYRDTMGRTRTDQEKARIPDLPPGANIQPQLLRLAEITDPVAGYRIILDPFHQIAHRMAVQARQNQAPNAATVARMAANRVIPARTNENGSTVKSENLGTQTILGVSAVGQRTTTTYPIGTFQGNDQPVTMVNENWRSDQYGLVLRSLNSGVNGDSTTTMKDFSIEEPDATLFQIPAGYQIVDETADFTITIPRSAI